MTEKIEKLEKDAHAGQDVVADRVVKRLKRERGLEFKKKGHEMQYLFNDEIKDKMETTTAAITKANPAGASDRTALEQAKKELQEGIQTILQQQKLIRLADRLEYGWDAVNEYEKDKLAEDDDDAKHLEKAEKAAEQKALKKRKTATRSRGRNRLRCPNIPPAMQQSSQPPPGATSGMPTAGFSQSRGASYPSLKIPRPCFHCLKMGHLKANCPELVKPYPYVISGNESSLSDKISSVNSSITSNVSSDSSNDSGTNSSVEHGKRGTLEGVNVKTIMSGQQQVSDYGLQSDERTEAASLVKAVDNSLLCGDKPPTGEAIEPLEMGASGMDQP